MRIISWYLRSRNAPHDVTTHIVSTDIYANKKSHDIISANHMNSCTYARSTSTTCLPPASVVGTEELLYDDGFVIKAQLCELASTEQTARVALQRQARRHLHGMLLFSNWYLHEPTAAAPSTNHTCTCITMLIVLVERRYCGNHHRASTSLT